MKQPSNRKTRKAQRRAIRLSKKALLKNQGEVLFTFYDKDQNLITEDEALFEEAYAAYGGYPIVIGG